MENRTTKSSKGRRFGVVHASGHLQFTCCLLAVYLLFACCPHHVRGKPHGHVRCQQVKGQSMCPLVPTSHAKPKRGLAPLAMPRPSHFLTICQEYPGGQNCCCHFPLSLQPTRWHKTHINMAVGPPPITQAPTVAIGAPKAHMGGIYCPA